jgi:hypothetical protein
VFLLYPKENFQIDRVDCHLCKKPDIRGNTSKAHAIYSHHRPLPPWTLRLCTFCKMIHETIYRFGSSLSCTLNYYQYTLQYNRFSLLFVFLDKLFNSQLILFASLDLVRTIQQKFSCILFVILLFPPFVQLYLDNRTSWLDLSFLLTYSMAYLAFLLICDSWKREEVRPSFRARVPPISG